MEADELKAIQAPEIDTALSRAVLYSALALGFRPPEEETISRLCSKDGSTALAEAAALLDPDQESALAAACLRLTAHASWFDPSTSLRTGRLTMTLSGIEGSLLTVTLSHRRLFGHTAHSGVPPYETEYGAEALFQQPQELGDLHGFYNAFGLALNRAEHERADHVSCECEFLAFLALKEAYALEHGDTSMLEETRKAERLFLRDHLARFLPAFANRLAREDGGGFYHALGELARRLIARECARWNVPLGPGSLSLRPATDDRVPMACGTDSCPAMPGTVELDEME
jgi:TorA maturation chaperone TorD